MKVLAVLFVVVAACEANTSGAKPHVNPATGKPSEKCWPREDFMLAKAADGCPAKNWKEGSVTNFLYRNSSVPKDIAASVEGSYLTLNYCGHALDIKEEGCTDAETPAAFPPGAYCLYMYKLYSGTKITQNCPAGFKWSWIAFDDVDEYNQASHKGATPLGEFFSFSTVLYYCCRNDGDPNKEIVLPNKNSFVLLPTQAKKDCQKVKGMNARKDEIFYSTEDADADNNGPPSDPDFPPPEYKVDVERSYWGRGLHLSTCTYTPKSGSSNKVSVQSKTEKAKTEKAAPTCWPKSSYGFWATKDGCPSGDSWGTGTVVHWEKPGGKSTVPDFQSGSVDDQTLSLDYCMHSRKSAAKETSCTKQNTAEWMPGSYCFFHYEMSDSAVFDKSCPKGFSYNWFVIDDVNKDNGNNFTGEVPSGEYYDFNTVYYSCCRNDGNVDVPISLPTDKPFILMPTATDRKCQEVAGMKSTYSEVFFDTEDLESNLVPLMKEPYIPPDYILDNPKDKWGAGMRLRSCYYEKK